MTLEWLPEFLQRSSLGYVLCDNSQDGTARLFWGCHGSFPFRAGDDVALWWQKLHLAQHDGKMLAGAFCYEFSQYLNQGYVCHQSDDILAFFCAFDHCSIMDNDQVQILLDGLKGPSETDSTIKINEHQTSISETEYTHALKQVQQHIFDGDSYQVNYTLRIKSYFSGHPIALYQELRKIQPVRYGAVIAFPEFCALSCSPELFFQKTEGDIVTKPMKGTLPRAASPKQEAKQLSAMGNDPKTLAENVMIVDLLRNDLGRVAVAGSVQVDSLFDIETYPTLHQMTSTIRAKIDPKLSLEHIIQQIFPSGSITGAPKKRTMQIIRDTETTARNLYTGSIGYVLPNNDMCFNVAIRTLQFKDDTLTMGIGGGIVTDSEIQAEYQEALLKARFLMGVGNRSQLIETLRISDDAPDWPDHRARLLKSAKQLNFAVQEKLLDHAVATVCSSTEGAPMALRLALSSDGQLDCTTRPLPIIPQGVRRVTIAQTKVNSQDMWLKVKSTDRALYDDAYQQAEADGLYEVVFLNEHDVITECCRHNLFVRNGMEYSTTPTSAGLLAGITRNRLIAQWQATERPLTVQDLYDADEILLCNALRGVVSVTLQRDDA